MARLTEEEILARIETGMVFSKRGLAKAIMQDDIRRYLLEKAIERDGDECWFCGGAWGNGLLIKTLEHLLGRRHQHGNRPENCVAAHRICNNDAGLMSLEAKKKLRDRYRRNPQKILRKAEAWAREQKKRKAARKLMVI